MKRTLILDIAIGLLLVAVGALPLAGSSSWPLAVLTALLIVYRVILDLYPVPTLTRRQLELEAELARLSAVVVTGDTIKDLRNQVTGLQMAHNQRTR